MPGIVIFGNSASGKSTLARRLCEARRLPHLDLDTVAWMPTTPPERRALDDSRQAISSFLARNADWVVEGCYSDLLEFVLPEASEIIFMNLPVSVCMANARNRPWEPHKYPSRQAQDANLAMLLDWISQYTTRDDGFSKASHEALFESHGGRKTMITNNEQSAAAARPAQISREGG